MSNNQTKNKKDTGLLIAGIILCFTPAVAIGVILIIIYMIRNKNTLADLIDNNIIPKMDQQEKSKELKIPSKCPNCGANVKKNETKCTYCDTNF